MFDIGRSTGTEDVKNATINCPPKHQRRTRAAEEESDSTQTKTQNANRHESNTDCPKAQGSTQTEALALAPNRSTERSLRSYCPAHPPPAENSDSADGELVENR